MHAQSSPIVIKSSYYFVDKGSTYNIDNIRGKNSDWFRFTENQNIKYGYNTDDAIWCRINLLNPTNENIEKWLVFDNIYLDSVNIYVNDEVSVRGDRTSDEKAVTIKPSFRLNIQANDSLQVIARLKKGTSFFEFKYHLTDEYLLLRSSRNQLIFYTFVFGLISLFFLFNFILYFVTKRSIYIRYSWYVIMIIVYLSISCGFVKFVLFPEFLFFSEWRIYSSFVAFSSMIMFITYYMNFKETQKIIYKIIVVSNYANWSILVVSLGFYFLNLVHLFKPVTLINYSNVIISLIVLVTGLILSLKTQRKKAIYTLSIFFLVVIWALLFIVKETTSLDFNHNIDWLFVSNIYELILFGVLLAIDYYKTFIINQKLMQEVIVEKQRNLKAFSEGEIIERKRLANTLHDNFGSRLSAIQLFMDQLSHNDAKKEIVNLSTDIRNLSHQIMPRSLQEGALVAAVQKHVAIQNEANPTLLIELFDFDMPEKINEPWLFDIYLISQEIINNTVKHADANSLVIEMYAYDNEYIFQYIDNGKGLTAGSNKGMGLENIELRIKNHNGKFEINSSVNEGVTIIVQLPRSK